MEIAAAQLLLIRLCRAQNLRKQASSRTAWNQEPPLSLRKARASIKPRIDTDEHGWEKDFSNANEFTNKRDFPNLLKRPFALS
jgi:hypothetical protein